MVPELLTRYADLLYQEGAYLDERRWAEWLALYTEDAGIIVEGEGEYYVGEDKTEHVQAGMVACASAGTVHGLKNTGNRKLVYVSVSSPQPLDFRMVKVEDAQRYAGVTGRQ